MILCESLHLLAAALKAEAPDLILTGLQSDDLGYGQTGVVLAELLGLPSSTIIMQVEILTGKVRVKRELEDGWFQHIEMPLPAVLTIQSGLNKLRYATLMGIKKAKTKEIKVVSARLKFPRLRQSSKDSTRRKRTSRGRSSMATRRPPLRSW